MMNGVQRVRAFSVSQATSSGSPHPPFMDILLIVGLGLVMKTIDSGTDIWTVVNLYINNHHNWSLIIFIPILFNTLITAIAWMYIENPRENGWKAARSFPLVLFQLYPQYRAVRLMLIGFGRWVDDTMYDGAKQQYSDTIAKIEGLFESIPELFCISYFIIYILITGLGVEGETYVSLKSSIDSSCLAGNLSHYSLPIVNYNETIPSLPWKEEKLPWRTKEMNDTMEKCIDTYYDEVIKNKLIATITKENFKVILDDPYLNNSSHTKYIPRIILVAIDGLWPDIPNDNEDITNDDNKISLKDIKFRAFQSYIFFIGDYRLLLFSLIVSFLSASFTLTTSSLAGPGFSHEANKITKFAMALIFFLNMIFLWHKIVAASFICVNIQNHEEKLPYILLLGALTLPHLFLAAFSLFVRVELKKGGIDVNRKPMEVMRILRGYPFLLIVPCLSPLVLHLCDTEGQSTENEEEVLNDEINSDHNPNIVTTICNFQTVINALLHFGMLIFISVSEAKALEDIIKSLVGFLYFYLITVTAIILALIGLIALVTRGESTEAPAGPHMGHDMGVNVQVEVPE